MSSAPDAEQIWKDARWLAQAVDVRADLVRVVDMDQDAYRDASFLDDRMLQPGRNAHLLKWSEVAEAKPENARSDARWIFHIGHVGSTLIARLLGELEGVLSVREPRLLRDVAMLGPQHRRTLVPAVRGLLSRTFGPAEFALVKATSFVSEMAAELVPEQGKALFIHAPPRTYIQTILAGDNSRKELQMLADTRAARMAQRVPRLDGWRKSEAHLAAAAWACEMTSLVAAERALPGAQVQWEDFDRLLGDVSGRLLAIACFFGFSATVERTREIASGPLMTRYSKALEYEYSPGLRRELLMEAQRNHGRAIDGALAMLDAAARECPLLARALDLSQSAS